MSQEPNGGPKAIYLGDKSMMKREESGEPPKKLLRAAHLEMCEKCHLHGVIVYSDGSKSKTLVSQSDAAEEIARARGAGLLHSAEVTELARQIRESLATDKDLDVLGDLAILVVAAEHTEAGCGQGEETERMECPGPKRMHPICNN